MSRRHYYRTFNEETGRELSDRLGHLRGALHLLPAYRVLDIGCAEGLISMEIAPWVSEVLGLDIRPQRIQAARKLAQQRQIHNVRYEVASLFDITLTPLSYDVVLFLGVYHQLPEDSRLDALRMIFDASSHQVAIRTRIHRDPRVRDTISKVCREKDFAVTFEHTHEAERRQEPKGLRALWRGLSQATITLHKSFMLVATRLGVHTFFLCMATQVVLGD